MKFDNVHLKLEDLTSGHSVKLEDALCLMSMVSQDINTGMNMPIDNLQVSDWNRFRLYLLRLSNTVSRLYTKHQNALLTKTPHRHDNKLWSNLEDASQRLAELVEEEENLEDKKAALTAELEKVKLKEALILELNNQIAALEHRKKQLRSTDLTALEKRQEELENSLQELQRQIAELRKQNNKTAGQIDTAQTELQQEQIDSSNLEQELQKNQRTLAAAQQKRMMLQEVLGDSKANLDTLNSEILDLNNEIQAISDQIKRLNQEIAQAKTARTTLLNDLQVVQQQVGESEFQLRAVQQELAAAYESYALVRQQLDEAKQNLDIIKDSQQKAGLELEAARTEYEERTAQLVLINDSITRIEKELEDLKSNINIRQGILLDKENARKPLLCQLDDCNEQILALTEELARLTEQRAALLQKQAELDNTIQTIQQSIDELTQDELLKNDQIQQMIARSTDLEASIEVLTPRLEESMAECDRLSMLEASIKLDIQTTEDTLDGLRDENRTLVAALEELRQNCAGEEKTLTERRGMRDMLTADLEKMRAAYAAIEDEIRQTEALKTSCIADIEALQQSNTREKTELDDAINTRQQLQNQLSDAQAEKKGLDEDIETLRADLDKLANVNQQRQDTNAALDRAKQDLADAEALLNQLNDELSKHNSAIQTLCVTTTDLRSNLSEAARVRQLRQTDLDDLQTELEGLQSELKTLADRCASLENQVCEAKHEHDASQNRIETLQTQLQEAQSANESMISTVLDLESRLSSQDEDNESYRSNVLTPAMDALQTALDQKAEMEQTVRQQDADLAACKEERRKLGDTINQTKTLIGLKKKENADRQKELDDEQNRLDGLIRDAEAEHAKQQKILDDLNAELNALTNDKIQPLLDAIKRAEEMLRELDPEATLQKYQLKKTELENQVEETKQIGELLKQLELDLQEKEHNLAQVRHEYNAMLDTQVSIQNDHDKYAAELQFLASDSKRQEIEGCQKRLDTMKVIRQNMMAISKEIGMGMDYSDALDKGLAHAEDILAQLRSNIAEYTSQWQDKIDQ